MRARGARFPASAATRPTHGGSGSSSRAAAALGAPARARTKWRRPARRRRAPRRDERGLDLTELAVRLLRDGVTRHYLQATSARERDVDAADRRRAIRCARRGTLANDLERGAATCSARATVKSRYAPPPGVDARSLRRRPPPVRRGSSVAGGSPPRPLGVRPKGLQEASSMTIDAPKTTRPARAGCSTCSSMNAGELQRLCVRRGSGQSSTWARSRPSTPTAPS